MGSLWTALATDTAPSARLKCFSSLVLSVLWQWVSPANCLVSRKMNSIGKRWAYRSKFQAQSF